MKIHYQDFSTDKYMPIDLKQSKYIDCSGTACGYMRKHVTLVKNKVTCFYCKKIINKGTMKKVTESTNAT